METLKFPRNYEDLSSVLSWVHDQLKANQTLKSVGLHVLYASKAPDAQKVILEETQEVLKDNVILGCHYIEQFNLWDKLDIHAQCLELANNNNIEVIVKLLGK